MIKLDTIESEFGTINVFKKKSTGTITYEQDGYCQSEADNDGISLASYIHAIFGLILQTKARKILMIGGAGGTLATMLVKVGRKVTIVDVNPDSFALARRYFSLPESVECYVGDGKSFLYSNTDYYDVIVLDAFHGARIPAHLKSLSFYYLVSDHLAKNGVVLANIHVENDSDTQPDKVADCFSNVFHEVRLLDSLGYNSRNAIIMAGGVSHLRPPSLVAPPAVDRDLIEAELATMEFRSGNLHR